MLGADSYLALMQMVGSNQLAIIVSMVTDVTRSGQGDNAALAVPIPYEIPIAR
jgi:hypothetical protein